MWNFLSSLFQVLYKTQSVFRTGGPIFPDNHTRNALFPFFQFVLAIMTKTGKLCGDCRRNLMVVLHKLKILNGILSFLAHHSLCKKCPEIARDKVEYLQNLTKPNNFHEKL